MPRVESVDERCCEGRDGRALELAPSGWSLLADDEDADEEEKEDEECAARPVLGYEDDEDAGLWECTCECAE